MISIRQLLIIGLIAAGLWFFKRISAQVKGTLARKGKPGSAEAPVVNTVRCKYCGLHLSGKDALKGGTADQYFCCRDHKSAHEKEVGQS